MLRAGKWLSEAHRHPYHEWGHQQIWWLSSCLAQCTNPVTVLPKKVTSPDSVPMFEVCGVQFRMCFFKTVHLFKVQGYRFGVKVVTSCCKYGSMQRSECNWSWKSPSRSAFKKVNIMRISSLNCNQSFAVLDVSDFSYVAILSYNLWITVVFDCCKGEILPVERSSKREDACVNSSKSSSVALRFAVIWLRLSDKWSGFPFFDLSGGVTLKAAAAVRWLIAAKVRILALSARSYDLPDMMCWIMFFAKISPRSSS